MTNDKASLDLQLEGMLTDIKLSKILDIPVLQTLSDSFFNFTGMAVAIIDLDGNILVASGWKKICTDFHRKDSASALRCKESNTILANKLKNDQQFNVYKCKNGLIDAATPIIIENRHLGNLFSGQFLFETPDRNYFIKQAEQFGFDREQYLSALAEVPVLSEDQVQKTMKYLADLTVIIGNTGIDKKKLELLSRNLEKEVEVRTLELRQTNEQLRIEIDERKKVEEAFQQSVLWQNEAVRTVNIGLWDWDLKTNKVRYSKTWKNQIGYREDEISDSLEEWKSRVHPDDLEKVLEETQKSISGQSSAYQTEFRFRHKDGTYCWILTQGSVLQDESGQSARMVGSHLDITERKQISDHMAWQGKEKSIILDNTPVGIAFLKDRQFIWLNNHFTTLFGYDIEEMQGASTEMCHPSKEAYEKLGETVYPVVAKGETYQGQWLMKRKDESLFWCNVAGEAVNPQDLSQGSIWVLEDISKRLEAEEYARRQAQIMDQIHDSVISMDLKGVITSWNKGSENLFQYKSEEAIGNHISALYPVQSHEWLGNEVMPDLLKNDKLEIETTLVKKKGHAFDAMISLSVLKDENDRINGMIAYTIDISGRKKAEAALQERENFLNCLLEAIPVPVFYKDNQERYLGCNPAFEKFYGETKEYFIGKTIFDIAPPDLAAIYHAKDVELLESGATQHYQTQAASIESGLRDILLSKAVFRDNQGRVKGLVGTALDITERNRTQLQIKKSLREKETLLKEVHHRVKNNLAVILSLLNLQSYQFKDERIKTALRESGDRIKSMALIHETLYQSEDIGEIFLKEYVVRLGSRLLKAIGDNSGRISLKYDIEDLYLNIDQAIPCGLILNELLTNALKYAFPEGGGNIHVSASQTDNNEIELIVKDNGKGLPEGDLDIGKIASFGLNIVSIIIENQLEGTLDIRNEKGACFTVRWPISTQ